MEVLLDTSFILSAVRNKIDIFEELLGERVLIPTQVIQEIERIAKSKKKLKEDANLTLKIIEKNEFKEIDIGKGHVDSRILWYAKKHPSIVIATLDRGIKRKFKGGIMVIRGKKRFEIL